MAAMAPMRHTSDRKTDRRAVCAPYPVRSPVQNRFNSIQPESGVKVYVTFRFWHVLVRGKRALWFLHPTLTIR
jgi:hypothetical protein